MVKLTLAPLDEHTHSSNTQDYCPNPIFRVLIINVRTFLCIIKEFIYYDSCIHLLVFIIVQLSIFSAFELSVKSILTYITILIKKRKKKKKRTDLCQNLVADSDKRRHFTCLCAKTYESMFIIINNTCKGDKIIR